MKKYQLWIPNLILLLAFVTSLLVLGWIRPPASTVEAKEGYLDLSNWDFSNNKSVELKGEWAFYPDEFIRPSTSDEKLNAAETFLQLPSGRKDMETVIGRSPANITGTLQLKIRLPEGSNTYGIRSRIVLSAYELYVNGLSKTTVGKIGTDKKTSLPMYQNKDVYFVQNNETLEILYHTADYHLGDGAIMPPILGLSSHISDQASLNTGRDLCLFGMLFIMAIYHLGLYWMRRGDSTPLYFGIFCLCFGIRTLLVNERFLPSHFPVSIITYGKIGYICVFIGFSALCIYLYHALQGIFSRRFKQLAVGIGAIASFLSLLLPYKYLDPVLIAYALIGVPLLGYSLYRLIISVLKRREFAGSILIGYVCLSMTLINDLIYQITMLNRPSMIPLGIAVFTLSQAYTLSAKFSNAFSHAEQLSEENAEMTDQLRHINTNLEKMVEIRTLDLRNALREVEALSKTDYLTKLPNRRMIIEYIEKASENGLCLALADIDKFKQVNDTYGHDVGDQVLIEISEVVQIALGDQGIVGRWGGEEFLMVLYTPHLEEASSLCEMVRSAVANMCFTEKSLSVTITVGVAKRRPETTIDLDIANADAALYQGKIKGRNQCQLHSS